MNEIYNAYIPSGMNFSVKRHIIPQNRLPVEDASLTGCKKRGVWNFLPSELFLKEHTFRNSNHYRLFIFHSYVIENLKKSNETGF